MAVGTACIYLSAIMVLRPLLLWRMEKRYLKMASTTGGFPIVPPKT